MSVLTGIDNINSYKTLLSNKKIGLVTNCTGVNSMFESTIDILFKQYNLIKLFAPEHGVRSDLEAGVELNDYIDEKTGLPVISLYGSSKEFPKHSLDDIDILAIDIQDIGSRFYTYLYTMAYAMQACKKYDKKLIIFDRVNPINGIDVEGNILDPNFKSFIGLYPITWRYGLTIGELAMLFNQEFNINCDLEIVKLDGWKREMYFDDTGLNWILPSPNIPTIDSCLAFNATVIFEGTNISEGRGTTKPFQLIGAPWIDADLLCKKMNDFGYAGVHFRPHYFTPTFSKNKNELCHGLEMHILNRHEYKAVKIGLSLLYTVKEISNGKFEYIQPYEENQMHFIDRTTGNSYIRENVYSLEKVIELYEKETRSFKALKTKYHLY